MAMHIDIAITGLLEVASRIEALATEMDNTTGSLVMQAAKIVIDEARPNAPVAAEDSHVPPGHAPGTLRGRGLGRALIARALGMATAAVGFNRVGWYGIFTELGTSRIPARPFMVPAFERKKDEIMAKIGNAVAQAVNNWNSGTGQGFFNVDISQ